MIAIGVVALIHVGLGYAFVTGLALSAIKAVVNKVEAVNIKEKAPPPDEPPPPPPKDIEIPPYVPPPEVTVAQDAPAPTITTQATVPQPEPPKFTPPAPPRAEPAPPTGPTQGAVFDPRSLAVSEDDYPPASLRAAEEGSTRIKVTTGVNGRVTACEVVQPSGFPRLDEKSCKLATTRWRSKPALQNGTPVEATVIRSVKWVINTK